MAKQLTRSAVRIYGALSSLGNESGDLLEGLLPFFDPILRPLNGTKLDPDIVAAAVRDTYHWNFNSDLVESFVSRFVRQGWLSPDIRDSSDTTYTIHMANNNITTDSEQTVEADLQRIALQFKLFSEELSPLTTIPREVEEFADILVEWLLYEEMFSEKSADFSVVTRKDGSGKIYKVVEVPNITALSDEDKYLCARFVKHTLETNAGDAEVLSKIAAIGLLTEVVQDFIKPATHVDKTDLIVYLDAPVALEYLNVSGKSAYANIEPVIKELIRIGATVRVFGQSVEEIKRTLTTVLSAERPYGPTADAIRRGEVMREYVIAVSRTPETMLEELGIHVAYRTLIQNPNEHVFFTEEHREGLYGRLNYQNTPEGREHDADITTLAMRQRNGKSSPDIFRSGCIVLTRNGLLAQIVRRVCVENGLLPPATIPPVVHRRVLVTAMWLRTGMGAADLNIPKRMLLASCERVLAIKPSVVDAVRKLTDALDDGTKSQQLELLISQDRSVTALMDKTLGSSSVVTPQNLSELWQEMLYPHLEAERQKGAEAISRTKAAASKQLETERNRVKAAERAAAEQAVALTSQINAIREEDEETIGGLCSEVERKLLVRRIFWVAVAIILAIASCVPVFLSPSTISIAASVTSMGVLSYLTLTGGKLIGVRTDEPKAVALLLKAARKRRLQRKLEQFDVNWVDGKFSIERRHDRSAELDVKRVDLFNPQK